MTLHAWRIVKAKRAPTAFTGDGAEKFGGRWNSQGMPVVYTAGSISLAILELLVHLPSQELLKRYVLFEVIFAEAFVTTPKAIPKSWQTSPPLRKTQQLGDDWLNAKSSAVLRVPSVIVPKESIYLLNPAHSDFAKIAIGPKQPMKFDPRLMG